MSDEERLARLTELALQVWPSGIVEHGEADADYGPSFSVWVPDPHRKILGIGHEALSIIHPRALDALEAALLVMTSDTPVVDLLWLRDRKGKP
jgi:hypothetical protein